MTKIDDPKLKVEPAPLRVSRVFPAPRETVFRAWSSADHIKRWFCPDGYSVPEAKVEVRVAAKMARVAYGLIKTNSDYALSILRIVVALLFLQHGLSKFFGFPEAGPPLAGLIILAAIIETVGGLLLLVGLFTRLAAFVMSGEMAFAYAIRHDVSGQTLRLHVPRTAASPRASMPQLALRTQQKALIALSVGLFYAFGCPTSAPLRQREVFK